MEVLTDHLDLMDHWTTIPFNFLTDHNHATFCIYCPPLFPCPALAVRFGHRQIKNKTVLLIYTAFSPPRETLTIFLWCCRERNPCQKLIFSLLCASGPWKVGEGRNSCEWRTISRTPDRPKGLTEILKRPTEILGFCFQDDVGRVTSNVASELNSEQNI